jgi:hypothetical protein
LCGWQIWVPFILMPTYPTSKTRKKTATYITYPFLSCVGSWQILVPFRRSPPPKRVRH